MAKGGAGYSLTFSRFLCDFATGVEYGTLPGDVEEDFDGHVCW